VVIKVVQLVIKPVVDVLYVLSTMYDKVAVVKPSVANAFTGERYLVCTGFHGAVADCISQLITLLSSEAPVRSVLEGEPPYYFVTRVEESSILIAHHQLDYLEQVYALVRSKNRDEKVDVVKKTNIQKCIQWCERHKIPFNKFKDKVNIFLNGEKGNTENTNIFLNPRVPYRGDPDGDPQPDEPDSSPLHVGADHVAL
jgi:hypothetical protein